MENCRDKVGGCRHAMSLVKTTRGGGKTNAGICHLACTGLVLHLPPPGDSHCCRAIDARCADLWALKVAVPLLLDLVELACALAGPTPPQVAISCCFNDAREINLNVNLCTPLFRFYSLSTVSSVFQSISIYIYIYIFNCMPQWGFSQGEIGGWESIRKMGDRWLRSQC